MHICCTVKKIVHSKREYYGAVWFVAKRATLCLRLVVRIEELTLGTKVWQSGAS
jgi:hypothetical protein